MTVKRKYQVEKLEGVFMKTVYERVGNENVMKQIECPMGWMVYFPQGHSVHFDTKEKLDKAGFGGSGLYDPATDASIDEKEDDDLVAVVKANTRRVRVTGGANIQDPMPR